MGKWKVCILLIIAPFLFTACGGKMELQSDGTYKYIESQFEKVLGTLGALAKAAGGSIPYVEIGGTLLLGGAALLQERAKNKHKKEALALKGEVEEKEDLFGRFVTLVEGLKKNLPKEEKEKIFNYFADKMPTILKDEVDKYRDKLFPKV